MLLDQNAVFSEKQAVTATAASTNVVDKGAAGNAVPGGLFAVCRTDEAFAGLTGLKVALQTADDAAFTSAQELVSASFLMLSMLEKIASSIMLMSVYSSFASVSSNARVLGFFKLFAPLLAVVLLVIR